MKIVVPSAGPIPDQRTVSYIVNLAEKLQAELIVLRILAEKEKKKEGKKSLALFIEKGQERNVPINRQVRRGDIASLVIETAEAMSADLIILGLSCGEIVAEWMNAHAMEKTEIPVLIIPKWVPFGTRPPQASNPCGETESK